MNPYSYNDEDEMPKDLKENEIIGWKFQVDSILTNPSSPFHCVKITNLFLLREMIAKYPKDDVADVATYCSIMDSWRNIGSHPNIVQLLCTEVINGIPRTMIEYIPSLSLQELISNRTFYTDIEKPALSMKIFRLLFSMAKALNYAHTKRLFHLNLKPTNILQIHNRNLFEDEWDIGDQFCVTDFGSLFLLNFVNNIHPSKLVDFNSVNLFWYREILTNSLISRPSNLVADIVKIAHSETEDNPLLKNFLKKITSKTDIYGFGMILLYILTGKICWQSTIDINSDFITQLIRTNSVPEIEPQLITLLLSFLQKCLDIERGFQDFTTVIAELSHVFYQYKRITVEIKGLESKSTDELEYEACLKVNIPAYYFMIGDYIEAIKQIEMATQSALQIYKVANNKQKILSALEFNDSIIRWLLGLEYDYNIYKKFQNNNLFLALMYDYQRRISKAIGHYREALKTAADSRFISVLKRQKLLITLGEPSSKFRLFGHTEKNDIFHIKVTNDTKRALSLSRNQNIILWDLEKLVPVEMIEEPLVVVGDMSGDAKVIALGTRRGKIILFTKFSDDLAKYERSEIDAYNDSVTLLIIANTGRKMITAGYENGLILWDVATKEKIMHIDTKEVVSVVGCDGNMETLAVGNRNSKNIQIFKKEADKIVYRGELLEVNERLTNH